MSPSRFLMAIKNRQKWKVHAREARVLCRILHRISSLPLSPPIFLTFYQVNTRNIILCMFLNYRNYFLDYLQQVPCEQDFSSRKETYELQRNRVNPKLLEVLKVRKFSHKKNRLSFMDDLIAHEENYTISGQISEAAELCKAGKMDGIRDMIRNSEDRQH